MPCLVGCYDTFRACNNPKTISQCCCCYIPCGQAKDAHDKYYNNYIEAMGEEDAGCHIAMENDLKRFIKALNCGPILIRLAWHDSGTYDQRIKEQFKAGGAIGTIQYDGEMSFGANAGLKKALGYLSTFKKNYPQVSMADLIQVASVLAVEVMGGPKIPFRYGRKDGAESDCAGTASREGFATHAGLPDAAAPFGCGAKDPATHLRNVFTKKMGFNDEEIVALSGAHTIGRTFQTRSGTCPFGEGPGKGTSHTNKPFMGMNGGQSWTKNWLKFDNAYFKEWKEADKDLQWLATDAVLFEDKAFKVFADKFAADQGAFFTAYAKAHKKLSELGAVWS